MRFACGCRQRLRRIRERDEEVQVAHKILLRRGALHRGAGNIEVRKFLKKIYLPHIKFCGITKGATLTSVGTDPLPGVTPSTARSPLRSGTEDSHSPPTAQGTVDDPFLKKKTLDTIIVLNCRFGTVASYYCTSPRHRLSGNPKLRCLPDGSWDGAPPDCRLKDAKPSTVGGGFLNKPGLPPPLGGGGGDRRPGGVDYTRVRSRRPFLKTQRENSAGKTENAL